MAAVRAAKAAVRAAKAAVRADKAGARASRAAVKDAPVAVRADKAAVRADKAAARASRAAVKDAPVAARAAKVVVKAASAKPFNPSKPNDPLSSESGFLLTIPRERRLSARGRHWKFGRHRVSTGRYLSVKERFRPSASPRHDAIPWKFEDR